MNTKAKTINASNLDECLFNEQMVKTRRTTYTHRTNISSYMKMFVNHQAALSKSFMHAAYVNFFVVNSLILFCLNLVFHFLCVYNIFELCNKIYSIFHASHTFRCIFMYFLFVQSMRMWYVKYATPNYNMFLTKLISTWVTNSAQAHTIRTCFLSLRHKTQTNIIPVF